MATPLQIRRLDKVEEVLPEVPEKKKCDLSVLTDSELHVLERYVMDDCHEGDLHIIESSIYPKLSANGEKTPSQ